MKQDWLFLPSMHFVLFFYLYRVNTGQVGLNIQHLLWFLDVKEVVSDDKSRISTLCIKDHKKNILKTT
jgi:hypothetical protein